MHMIRTALAVLLIAASAAAQEGALDVLDGETLYDGGWLFSTGLELERQAGLLHGNNSVSDPLDRERMDRSLTLSAHYGIRHDVQVSLLAPYVQRTLTLDDPTGPDRLSSSGLGDVTAVAKWRFYRWDAPGVALNVAAIGGLDVPTGATDERDHGAMLPPDLQPGSGSWDPFIGLAATHEPGRWRFNAFVLYRHNGQGARDFSFGDEFFAEISAGNRFWLEPYPGPFMRLDVMLRYRFAGRASDGGSLVHDSGGELMTIAANLAFRPQPPLDFQLAIEVPILQDVKGFQLEQDYTVFFAFGYRI